MTRRRPRPDPDATRPQAVVAPAVTGSITVERREERLVPSVERVEAGRLVIRRSVATEVAELDFEMSHDELDLERHSVDRPLEEGEQPIRHVGEEIVVLVVEERVEVRKMPWVVEEIRLRRRLVTEPRSVRDDVRRERIELETLGDLVLTEDPARNGGG